jgi:hypothetical protein
MKAITAIPASRTIRAGEIPVRGRSNFVSRDDIALGYAHATNEFLRQEPGEFRRSFIRQVRIIDPDARIV